MSLLQFYVAKSLYQIVVLSVGKDQISGYCRHRSINRLD